MRVIPVIDVSQGQVVHAVAGLREHYRPVRSRLCPDCNPVNIVQAFLDLYSFDTVYMADLDAISGKSANTDCLQNLLDTFPHLNFWLDRGMKNTLEMLNAEHPRIQHVIGSETNFSPALLPEFLALCPQPIMSLDFKSGKLLGDQGLLQQPQLWPDNIIFMDLDRVGTTSGVNKDLLGHILQITLHSHVFIGGGIKDIMDMRGLQAAGITGILVATALHTGKISTADMESVVAPIKKNAPMNGALS